MTGLLLVTCRDNRIRDIEPAHTVWRIPILIWLTHCRKCVYMGHCRFLPIRHQVRRKGKHFKGQADHRTKSKHRTGSDILEIVKDLEVVFGKGLGSQPDPSDNGLAPMWKKKSIFWEQLYWEVLDVRHAIDVMHLTKNLCINLIGLLGGVQKDKRYTRSM